MTNDQRWRRLIYWLRKNHPPHLPFVVRSVSDKALKGDDGDCRLNTERSKFEIAINKQRSFAVRVDTLLHELAHALTWFGMEQEEHHSAEWGLAYAMLYRAFHESPPYERLNAPRQQE